MVVQRYLVKEVLQTLTAVIAVLLLIFLGRHFARYLAAAAAGEIQADLILRLLTTFTLSSTALLIPFAFYVAVLLAFGRLYRDNEMVALAAAGVGTWRVLLPIGILSVAVALVVGWMALSVGPWAVEQGLVLREQAEAQSDLANISAGQFRTIGTQQSVFYIEQVSPDKKTMNRVFVNSTAPTGIDVLAAENAYQYSDAQSGDDYLVLLNGRRYEGTPGSEGFRIYDYAKASILIKPKEVQPRARKRDAQATADLLKSDDRYDRAELQWRLSMPISALLLGALAVLLSRTSPREGRYARLFGAILVYVIYNNLMGAAKSWLQRGTTPTFLGMWWVHFVLVGLIVYLIGRELGWRYIFSRGSAPTPHSP